MPARIAQIIDALRPAGPLNIVWGAACALPPKTYGIDWAHIGLAELFRAGRVRRLLTGNTDDGIVKAASLVRLLPELYTKDFPELRDAAAGSIYSFGKADDSVAAGLIERDPQSGPWLIFGAEPEEFALAHVLQSVPGFDQGLYWIGQFDQPAPKPLPDGAHFVFGFDAASFLAYLLRGLGEFPPAFVTQGAGSQCDGEPVQQLHRWRSRASEQIYRIRDSFPKAARELLQKASETRSPEYDGLVAKGIAEFEMYFRWSGSGGYAAAIPLGSVAEKRRPAEAIRLRRRALGLIAKYPGAASTAALQEQQISDCYAHVARFRTGAQADALFARAEAALSAIAPGPMGVFLLESCAKVLCDWADQERSSESDPIFDRARKKYAEAQRLEPENLDRLFRYCQALRHRATAVDGAQAMILLGAARTPVQEMLADGPQSAALWQLAGMIAMTEAQKSSEPPQAALAEAERCYREAVRLQPDAAGDVVQGWAAGLGLCGMERSGREAVDFYLLADAKFLEAETIKDSRALRKNWSSTLLRHAHEQGGPAQLWDRAKEQAGKAEAIDIGSGAYNLACIASDLGDREGVERWLTYSAEYGQIMPLSHTLRDVNFCAVLHEAWFRDLLDRIYDTGAPPLV